MREIHGVRSKRMSVAGAVDEQAVTVEDGKHCVLLGLSGYNFPSALTPDEARMVAKYLQASAKRVEGE